MIPPAVRAIAAATIHTALTTTDGLGPDELADAVLDAIEDAGYGIQVDHTRRSSGKPPVARTTTEPVAAATGRPDRPAPTTRSL